MIVALVGLAGIYCLTSFAQSTRLGFSGPISANLSLIQIPAAVSILWAVSLAIGWWSIAVFVVGSLIAGAVNGILLRNKGRDSLVVAQPIRAILFTVASVGVWIPLFLR